MENLRMLYRYVKAVATTYIMPEPPQDELVKACLVPGNNDVTHLVLGWLAAKSVGLDPKPSWALDKRLIIEYKHIGSGPYAVYYDPKEEVRFPPTIEGIKSVDDVIVMAENINSEKDVTDNMNKFAGPDGKFGGRKGADSWGTFDPLLIDPDLKKGEAINVSYANGNEITLKYD